MCTHSDKTKERWLENRGKWDKIISTLVNVVHISNLALYTDNAFIINK